MTSSLHIASSIWRDLLIILSTLLSEAVRLLVRSRVRLPSQSLPRAVSFQVPANRNVLQFLTSLLSLIPRCSDLLPWSINAMSASICLPLLLHRLTLLQLPLQQHHVE